MDCACEEKEEFCLYSVLKREGEIKKVSLKEAVLFVKAVKKRVEAEGYKLIIFPEAGAIPLEYIFKKINKDRKIKIFSSKITASSKAQIGKQICGFLSQKEKETKLSSLEKKDFLRETSQLESPIKKQIIYLLDQKDLLNKKRSEIIKEIAELNLVIPSEDKSYWNNLGLKLNGTDIKNKTQFKKIRKKAIKKILRDIDKISHPTRNLLNLLLHDTNFSKALTTNKKAYIIDEAISRGRTLNSIEIILRSFNKDAEWKIGCLYCPEIKKPFRKIDYIYNNIKASPFSNRLDLIGEIIIESEDSFSKYSIKSLLKDHKKVSTVIDKCRLNKSLFNIKKFISENNLIKKKGVLQEEDIIRLIIFKFLDDNHYIIKKCLDLNPVDCTLIIEETSFYINMPHPFNDINERNRYKKEVVYLLEIINKIKQENSGMHIYNKLKKEFFSIRKDYEYLELLCWYKRYKHVKKQLNEYISGMSASLVRLRALGACDGGSNPPVPISLITTNYILVLFQVPAQHILV